MWGINWQPTIDAMFMTAPEQRSTMPGNTTCVSSINTIELRVTSPLSRSSGNMHNSPLVPKAGTVCTNRRSVSSEAGPPTLRDHGVAEV